MSETEKLDFTMSDKTVIVTDKEIYDVELLVDINDLKEAKEGIAYVMNNIFYIYRGKFKGIDLSTAMVGIYDNPDGDDPKYVIVEPSTDEEREEFDALSHANQLLPESIIDTLNTKEDLLIAIPESTKVFQPVLQDGDDLLKRIIKLVLIAKNVDLDRHKDRFSNKNELFNLKQVIRGKNKVSILIFDRCCDALNVEYEIRVREKSKDFSVGDRLESDIIVSSEDTFDYVD